MITLRRPSSSLLRRTLISGSVALVMTSSAWAGGDANITGAFDAGQKEELRNIIHDYLLSNPEVVADAINKLEQKQREAEDQKLQVAAESVQPVSETDHIRGNRDATVKLIEFSDFECPFCKSFHPTTKALLDEYGKDGKVAIVYRHFPLDQLHSKARKEAQASECANELGGNDAFWAFVDKIFEVTPSNNQLDLAELPKIAAEIGLDETKFTECLAGDMKGGKYANHIEENSQDAISSGGTGTPYSLVISARGTLYPINGALPYASVKSIVDRALQEK
jgi:protein-disulfide isomerase